MLTKLKYGAINNKKIIIFLFGLSLIGIISGSLFITTISSNDKVEVVEHIKGFINNINDFNIKSSIMSLLISNIGFIILIWLLGISIIGIPIILFMFFTKIFIIGFTISSFILSYKTKGVLLAIIYVLPLQIINILIYTLITLYAIKISNNLIYCIFNKNTNYKLIPNKYVKILLISVVTIFINIIYESILFPFLLNKITVLLKI
ncbi:MAG: stage II sporulation protein M [Bacilli bacterium]|nr:stage II sporulation protein M [Bacilli bacterium]